MLHSNSSSDEEVEGDPALPGSFSHCLLQNPHNILPNQSLNMRQPACSPCFPHSSALDLNLVILRHTQKGTIEDGGTVRGNIILSMIYDIT